MVYGQIFCFRLKLLRTAHNCMEWFLGTIFETSDFYESLHAYLCVTVSRFEISNNFYYKILTKCRNMFLSIRYTQKCNGNQYYENGLLRVRFSAILTTIYEAYSHIYIPRIKSGLIDSAKNALKPFSSILTLDILKLWLVKLFCVRPAEPPPLKKI